MISRTSFSSLAVIPSAARMLAADAGGARWRLRRLEVVVFRLFVVMARRCYGHAEPSSTMWTREKGQTKKTVPITISVQDDCGY